MNDRTEPSAGELRQLLAVVLEALDIPNPATVGDSEQYHQVLSDRAMHTVIALQGALDEDGNPLGIAWTTEYLQERLTEHPATGYRAWGEGR